MKTPTMSAVETAVKNAMKAIREGYTVKQSAYVSTLWIVTKPNEEGFYVVSTLIGCESCDCPQFEEQGVCKHQKLVDDEIAIREAEEIEEEKLICPVCDSYPLFDNDSTCDRCEKRTI